MYCCKILVVFFGSKTCSAIFNIIGVSGVSSIGGRVLFMVLLLITGWHFNTFCESRIGCEN